MEQKLIKDSHLSKWTAKITKNTTGKIFSETRYMLRTAQRNENRPQNRILLNSKVYLRAFDASRLLVFS
jgi:hypothetical protein